MATKHFETNVWQDEEDGTWWATTYPLEMQGGYLTCRTDKPLSMMPLTEDDMASIGTIDGDDWYAADNGTMPQRLGEILEPIIERLRAA